MQKTQKNMQTCTGTRENAHMLARKYARTAQKYETYANARTSKNYPKYNEHKRINNKKTRQTRKNSIKQRNRARNAQKDYSAMYDVSW